MPKPPSVAAACGLYLNVHFLSFHRIRRAIVETGLLFSTWEPLDPIINARCLDSIILNDSVTVQNPLSFSFDLTGQPVSFGQRWVDSIPLCFPTRLCVKNQV